MRYFNVKDALGLNQIVSMDSVDGEYPTSANIKMYCTGIDEDSITLIKDKLVQYLTPNYLEQPKKRHDENKKKSNHLHM